MKKLNSGMEVLKDKFRDMVDKKKYIFQKARFKKGKRHG